jgi:hypothetical protein
MFNSFTILLHKVMGFFNIIHHCDVLKYISETGLSIHLQVKPTPLDSTDRPSPHLWTQPVVQVKAYKLSGMT